MATQHTRRRVVAGLSLAATAIATGTARASTPWLRDQVVVYADPTLKPLLTTLAEDFAHLTGAKLYVFAAPPRQMLELLAHNTQCDILITGPKFLNEAQYRGLVKGEILPLWRNRLVFAARQSSKPAAPFDKSSLLQALADNRLALPDPVPGSTVDGPSVLTRLGLDLPPHQIIGAPNAEMAADMVLDGTARLALVQATEIPPRPALQTAFTVPSDAYEDIQYGAVLTKSAWSRNQQKCLTFLHSAASLRTARAAGLEDLS